MRSLGAIARRYNINQYGITSSPLQGGLPSDRLIAEWWLKSKRVETLLEIGKNPPIAVESGIEVPAQIYDWKAAPETRGKAQQVQEQNREQFLQAFSQAWRYWVMSVTQKATVNSCWDTGMRNGRMRRKRSVASRPHYLW